LSFSKNVLLVSIEQVRIFVESGEINELLA